MNFSQEQLLHIYIEVAGGRGDHGDFLKSFANAYIRADGDNIALLFGPATIFVNKYNLERYLNKHFGATQ